MFHTVLFDLDGTLLPMDQDLFVKDYFGRLAAKLQPRGYDPKKLVEAVWAGTAAMVKNDGSCTNEQAFWNTFSGLLGPQVLQDMDLFEEYYRVEFQQVAKVCGCNPKAKETVTWLKNAGYRVALATNPLFPKIATQSRIRWAGLEPEDFVLYTTYEDTSYCKPNLDYYRDVLTRLNCRPEDCLMVGNDVQEDMCAKELGMDVFLLKDCMINRKDVDIAGLPQGGFDELIQYVKKMGDRQ